jgi:hypothetical protein
MSKNYYASYSYAVFALSLFLHHKMNLGCKIKTLNITEGPAPHSEGFFA